jgi:hypothetical protein
MPSAESPYISALETLYRQAVLSPYSEELLRQSGGILALAARDTHRVWFEEGRFAEFMGFERRIGERLREESQVWQEHRDRIREIAARQGISEDAAAGLYVQTLTGAKRMPSLEDLNHLTSPQMGTLGTKPEWQYRVEHQIAVFEQGLDVMGDTFPAIAAGAAAYVSGSRSDTGEWVPDWESGITFGAQVKPLTDALGAYAQARGTVYHPDPPERQQVGIVERARSPTGTEFSRMTTPSSGAKLNPRGTGGSGPPSTAPRSAARVKLGAALPPQKAAAPSIKLPPRGSKPSPARKPGTVPVKSVELGVKSFMDPEELKELDQPIDPKAKPPRPKKYNAKDYRTYVENKRDPKGKFQKDPKDSSKYLEDKEKAAVIRRMLGSLLGAKPGNAKAIGPSLRDVAISEELRSEMSEKWREATPPGETAEQAAERVYLEWQQTKPSNPNEFVREKLYDNWRPRALLRMYQDTTLRKRLDKESGIVLKLKGKTVTIGVRVKTGKTRTRIVPLNFDHVPSHARAVNEAKEQKSSKPLAGTVDPARLQLTTERENDLMLEGLRRYEQRQQLRKSGD